MVLPHPYMYIAYTARSFNNNNHKLLYSLYSSLQDTCNGAIAPMLGVERRNTQRHSENAQAAMSSRSIVTFGCPPCEAGALETLGFAESRSLGVRSQNAVSHYALPVPVLATHHHFRCQCRWMEAGWINTQEIRSYYV